MKILGNQVCNWAPIFLILVAQRTAELEKGFIYDKYLLSYGFRGLWLSEAVRG